MSEQFPVTGLAEIDKFLSYLPMNLQKGAYRAALTAAAKPIRDEAKLRAPRKTGQLAQGIKTGSTRQNQDGSFSVQISCTGPHGYLGPFLEFGTSPHFISAGDSGLSARKLTQKAEREGMSEGEHHALKIGDTFVTGTVHHPGIAARPFMRPALDTAGAAAVQAFADRLRAYIESKTGFVTPTVSEAA